MLFNAVVKLWVINKRASHPCVRFNVGWFLNSNLSECTSTNPLVLNPRIRANCESLRPAHQTEPWIIIAQWPFFGATVILSLVD